MGRLIFGVCGMLAFCVLPGCTSRTDLYLDSEEALDVAVAQLSHLVDAQVESARVKNGRFRIRFAAVLPKEKQALLRRILDRTIKVKGTDKPPTLRLEITETDPKLLEMFKKGQGGSDDLTFDLAIDPTASRRQLLVRRVTVPFQPRQKEEICAWRLGLKGGIPALTYELRLGAQAGPELQDETQVEPSAAADRLPGLSGTLAHRIVAGDPAYQSAADALRLDPPDDLYFAASSKTDIDVAGPGFDLAGEQDFLECSGSIVEKAPEALFSAFVLPVLSRSLRSYELKDAWF